MYVNCGVGVKIPSQNLHILPNGKSFTDESFMRNSVDTGSFAWQGGGADRKLP